MRPVNPYLRRRSHKVLIWGELPRVLIGGGDVPQPWQFFPENYATGAIGDGKVISDTVTVNGNTTITSASANFTSADAGKYIMIHGANGVAGGPLITTISSVSSPTAAVLAAAPTASVSNCPAVYGTDSTAAINAALTAAGNYAIANTFFAEVVFGSKIYVLGTGPTQTTSPVSQNSQVVLPYPNVNGTTQKMIIGLTGAGDAGFCQYFQSTVPNLSGTCLVSMTTAPVTVSPTFGRQSVVGGPSAGGAFGGQFANVKAVIRGISVWCGIYTNQMAWDLGYVAGCRVVQSSAHIFAPTGVNVAAIQPYLNNITAAAFTGSIGRGWRFPVTGNNADSTADDICAEGYELGFWLADHFTAGRLAAIYSDVAMLYDGTGISGTSHEILIAKMTAESYNGGLLVTGGTVQVDIDWDAENTGVTYDVSDSGNRMRGILRFRDPADPGRGITVTGAANLKIWYDESGPGHVTTPPAVPATGVNATLVWRDAWVSIHTGAGVTVSAITIDGTATGLTIAASSSLAAMVPSGKTIALTYAGGTPTWDWWLT